MSTAFSNTASEPVEAVIISGPRKGEIVCLANDEVVLSPEEQNAFDEVQAQAERTLQAAKDAVAAGKELLEEARTFRKELGSGSA